MPDAQMLIDFLYTHPRSYRRVQSPYLNVVAFTLPDTVIFPAQAVIFPAYRLEAQRLDASFCHQAPELLFWLAHLIDPERPPTPKALWLTTSHAVAAKRLYIEVAFE